MKYLNIGCGTHYSRNPVWTNLDFISTSENVIAHNLLKGIPFEDDYFDLVYHSHVLEHFSKNDGNILIKECYRVLKKGGTLRVAIPDLEQIAKKYLSCLEEGLNNPDNDLVWANYEWMLLEMYDQTVRNSGGGEMGKFLIQESLINKDFVYERIGEEAKSFIESNSSSGNPKKKQNRWSLKKIMNGFRKRSKLLLFRFFLIDPKVYELGKFRLGGEIHQWMYDRYSLTRLLTESGFVNIEVKGANESNLKNWEIFQLDSSGNKIRKPDSIFIEALK